MRGPVTEVTKLQSPNIVTEVTKLLQSTNWYRKSTRSGSRVQINRLASLNDSPMPFLLLCFHGFCRRRNSAVGFLPNRLVVNKLYLKDNKVELETRRREKVAESSSNARCKSYIRIERQVNSKTGSWRMRCCIFLRFRGRHPTAYPRFPQFNATAIPARFGIAALFWKCANHDITTLRMFSGYWS